MKFTETESEDRKLENKTKLPEERYARNAEEKSGASIGRG